MGNLREELENGKAKLARILTYGVPKTRKTWWALRAAEMGYNVILADFDNGSAIAHNLPAEALERILRIDCRVPHDNKYNNSAFATIALALQKSGVYYDETARSKVLPATFNADGKYLEFDFAQATSRDVLIFDSWTALCQQVLEFSVNTIDPLSSVPLEQQEYGAMRKLVDRVLANISKLNCHVIIIGHEIEYAKRRADAGPKDKPNEAIEWIKMSVGSVTKSHGASMPAAMSDVLHFGVANEMQGVYINTKAGPTTLQGSRTVAPQKKPWEELGIEKFLPALSEIRPHFDSKAVKTVTGADLLASAANGAGKTPTLNAKPQPTFKLGKPK